MQYNFTNFKNELKKVEDYLSKEYSQLNIGRASPMVLDGVSVDSYGSKMPIKNVATVSIEDPKTLRISPWDKAHVKEIEKAITAANLGLSVATDDAGIRVIFPQLTTETRQTLVKVLKEKLEESRISVRQVRTATLEDIENKQKSAILTEDEKFRAKEDLQKLTNDSNSKLEEIFKKKEAEVMG
jgi:ribosome recycling factor